VAWRSLQLNSSRRACCSSFEIACTGGNGGGGNGGGIVGAFDGEGSDIGWTGAVEGSIGGPTGG